uniref:Uncharacterized protein n=1 Tax=Kalanchoe fedtschenkoi TaxID=63787 RepID=A0A7N0RHI0_KALFE
MAEKKRSDKGRQIGWRLGAIVLGVGSWPSVSLFGALLLSQEGHRYSGVVEDCCCNYETMDHLNGEVLHPALQELVKTLFFRYFEAKLWCGVLSDDGICRLRDCSVYECLESKFPEPFRKPYHKGLSPEDLICQERKPEAAVDRTIDMKAFRGWVEVYNPWTNDDETDNAEMTYSNLQLNPGYTCSSARRIWDAIYAEIFSRSIVHIGADCLLDEATNLWGQNITLMYDRVLKHPDRVSNLYFTFLFVLRAVTKAAYYLGQAEYDTGNPIEDLKTQSLMPQLLFNSELQSACPIPFDEAKLWNG